MNRRAWSTALLAGLVLFGVWLWRSGSPPAPSLPGAAGDGPALAATDTAAPPNADKVSSNAAERPNMASYSGGAPANAREPGKVASGLPFPIDAHLDRSAARALFVRYRDAQNCLQARNHAQYFPDWQRDTGTLWLDAAERARVLDGLRASIKRLLGVCTRQGFNTSGEEFTEEAPGYLLWARLSAAASGDLAARLVELGNGRPVPGRPADQAQLVLHEAVADGDPELLALIAEQSRFAPLTPMPPSTPGSQSSRKPWLRVQFDAAAVWTLAACDLGMDCGPESPTLDRLCLVSGLCAYPSVEEALRDGRITDEEAEETQARRHWLVERIRSGQIAGLFDPPAG
jgi:hypothetical protein